MDIDLETSIATLRQLMESKEREIRQCRKSLLQYDRRVHDLEAQIDAMQRELESYKSKNP